jgi:hypothetical protein
MQCGATTNDLADYAAIAWIDAYERMGGRVWTNGRMFALTAPAQDCDLPPPDDLMAVVRAAYRREARRNGLEP